MQYPDPDQILVALKLKTHSFRKLIPKSYKSPILTLEPTLTIRKREALAFKAIKPINKNELAFI